MLIDGIMRNVQEKLAGYSWPPEAPAAFNESLIAILSAQLSLDLSPATACAKQYEEERDCFIQCMKTGKQL
jgi:hypothetical protein